MDKNNYIAQIQYESEEDKKKYHLVTIPTSRFLDIMNPFTGKIISKSSYEKFISDDSFIKAVNEGFINLYANSCNSLNENGQIKDVLVEEEFVKKYKLGVIYYVDNEYIKVCLNPKLDKEILEYIETNTGKCSAGVFGGCTEHMEGLDCISDIYYISGYQLYDAQYRPPVDIIFKLGQTYEERWR